MFVRRLAAVSADSPVDLNRDLADKPVGVRTLALVALGAATVSMAGIEVRQWPKAPEVPRSASQSPAALDLALDCDAIPATLATLFATAGSIVSHGTPRRTRDWGVRG